MLGKKSIGRVYIEVKDKNGNLIDKRVEYIHSYEHQWAALLCNMMQQLAYYGMVTPDNRNLSSVADTTPGNIWYVSIVGKPVNTPVWSIDEKLAKGFGIKLGYGDNQFSVTDTNLLQQISIDKLVPQDMNEPEIKDNYPNTGQVTIVLSRNFINQSGSSLKFNQVGLIAYIMVYKVNNENNNITIDGGAGGTIEVIFDKLSQDVEVPDSATVTVTMELTFN